MQFIKCIASKPGLFENTTLDFSKNITVVYGKNGSGKSLLAKMILCSIFKNSTGTDFLDQEVWDSSFFDLQFTMNGINNYKVSNHGNKYFKIFYSGNSEEKILYALDKTKQENTGIQDNLENDKTGTVLWNFYNKFDIDFFMNSSYIPSSSDINKNQLFDYSCLKKIILEDGSNFYNYYNNLKKIFGENTHAEYDHLSDILKSRDLQKDLDKEIQILNIKDTRKQKLHNEKNNVQKEIDTLKSSLFSLESQKEILFKIIDNLTKVDRLKNDFDNLKEEVKIEQKKIKTITNMKQEIEKLFPQFLGIDVQDDSNLDKLQEVFNEIRNLNERIDNFFFKKKTRKKKIFRTLIAVNIALISSLILILIKNSFDFSKDLYFITGIISFLLVFNPAVLLYYYLTSGKNELIRLQQLKNSLKQDIKTLLKKSNVELDDYKLMEVYEFLLQYFEDYIDYTERTKDLAKIKSSLKEKEYLVSIKEQIDTIKKEEETIKDEINISIDSLDIVDDIEKETNKIDDLINNIDREIEFIIEKIETKNSILNQIDEEINHETDSSSDELMTLLKEKDNVDQIIKKWETNQKSLKFLLDIFRSAVESSEQKQLKKLIESSLDKFHHLTGNQYLTSIDEEIINKLITENSIPDDFTPPVIHALLIAVKFSLSDSIIDSEMPIPMIIDDPFQFMDDDRCKRFRDMVSYMSETRQVIIFTHHSNKNDWGHYIEL